MLDLMVQTDDLAAGVKAADAALAAAERDVAGERVALEAERQRVETELASLARERQGVEASMPAELVRLFADVAAKRRGVAVAAIRDGHCAACQVRLRAQQVQEIRRGERVQQCESCGRILHMPPAADAGAPPAPA
jgi:predicted  nucleic acid-binding Zn-ribbon protein